MMMRMLASAAIALSAMALVWLSGAALPDVVAAHFGASGAADGFMSRQQYRVLMTLLVGIVPVAITLVSALASMRAGALLNLPNRQYWLAPERRASTLAYLATHTAWLASAVTVFICYVHVLVVLANKRTPPQLPSLALLLGAVGLFATIAVLVLLLVRRFRMRR